VLVVKKDKSKEFRNSNTCIATEYPTGDKDINIALVRILDDRYPPKGWAVNSICKEMAYIVKGEAILTTNNYSVHLSEGDVVLIEPNEKYYWEGDFEMVVPCAPAWFKKQHKVVEE